MRLSLLCLVLCALSAWAAPTATPRPSIWEPPFYNGVAAQVDKILITYDDLRREMAPMSAQVREASSSAQEYSERMNTLSREVLNNLVERALLVTEFQSKGYKVPPKDAELEYRRVLQENFGGKVSELIDSLQRQGLTLPAFRERLTQGMMVTALQSRFRSELPAITPQQIATYYAQNPQQFARSGRVQLSVITLQPLTDEPTKVLEQTANEIVDKARAGTPWDELTTQYNQAGDPLWDWLADSELSPALRAAVAPLQPGQISAPIVVEGGKVLVIRLVERQNEGVAPLAQVEETIKKQLFEKQAGEAYLRWIDQLKKKFYVQINA